MPASSFFLKHHSPDGSGSRFVIHEEKDSFAFIPKASREPKDEVFETDYSSFIQLKARLVELYPEAESGTTAGDVWFAVLLAETMGRLAMK